MVTSERRQELLDTIAAHLELVGPQKWVQVRSRFPDVSNATFWRCVAYVRDGLEPPVAKPAPAPPTPQSVLAGIEAAAVPAKTHIADMVAQYINGYPKRLYAIQKLQQLFRDAEELKFQSVGKNGRIRNSTMYAKSISLREKLLLQELSALEALVDDTSQQKFCDTVLDTIAAESPETKAKILDRLRKGFPAPKAF